MNELFDVALFHKKLAVLNAQIKILREVFCVQCAVRQAVYEKQWADFEFSNRALVAAKLQLEQCETERLVLFAPEQGGNSPACFYRYAAGLPQKERATISDAYRCLKIEAAKLRMASAAFQNYIKEIGGISKSFLDAAFPDRRGNLYGNRGAIKNADMRSLLLDRQF
jgi:hypothetical protein